MHTILGAGGAIGKPLARILKNQLTELRLAGRNPERVNKDDALLKADLTIAEDAEKAVKDSEVVYLLAGLPYQLKTWRRQWPLIMHNVIEACLKHDARLVFLDNVYMYAKIAIPQMTEQSEVDPPSKKGKIRKEIADMLMDAVQQKGLKALIGRSADFYGPENKASLMTIAVTDPFKNGKKAFWLGNVDKIHSFTYTPEAAAALATLAKDEKAYGEIWHLPTSSEKWTGRMFIEKIAEKMNVQPRFYTVKPWMLSLSGIFDKRTAEMKEMNYQNDRDYFFDSSKFEKRYKWTPVSYEGGLQEMLEQEELITRKMPS